MILALLGWLGGLFDFANGLLNWLSSERLRTLGRLEAENEQLNATLNAESIADCIDAQPDSTDPADLLKRLSDPSTASPDMGKAHLP